MRPSARKETTMPKKRNVHVRNIFVIYIQIVNHVMLLFLLAWFRDTRGYYTVAFVETNQCQHKRHVTSVN
jgi:hypothetical protein